MNTNRILLGLIVVLIALSFPAQAQDDGWSSALEVPGAQTLTEGSAEFTECFTSFSGVPWYKCEDTNGYYPNEGAQPVPPEHVWAQVHKDFDFTVSSPGHLYMIFESHEGVTIRITKKGKDGEWQVVSVSGLVRSATYYGTELRNSPEPVRYKINPDGSMEFERSQPGHAPVHVGPDQWLTPGQFRVTLISGEYYNYNIGVRAYVPSSGNVKVLFIPDVPEVTDSDGDGVPDDIDECHGTPAGVVVNDKGCDPQKGIECDILRSKLEELKKDLEIYNNILKDQKAGLKTVETEISNIMISVSGLPWGPKSDADWDVAAKNLGSGDSLKELYDPLYKWTQLDKAKKRLTDNIKATEDYIKNLKVQISNTERDLSSCFEGIGGE